MCFMSLGKNDLNRPGFVSSVAHVQFGSAEMNTNRVSVPRGSVDNMDGDGEMEEEDEKRSESLLGVLKAIASQCFVWRKQRQKLKKEMERREIHVLDRLSHP